MKRFIIAMAMLALHVLLTAQPVLAETRFVSGVNDGWRTYAYIIRNGAEYRTDEVDPVVNKHLWDELPAADRRALLNVYGWSLGRRAAHFGSDVSKAMADWINQEQGWTAAAEALKARHADKAFPTLTPVFGPGTSLTIPDFYCTNPEIANTASYQEASRLAVELNADYALGKQIYGMLTNAKWDQVSIATKTISGPLIKIIVDNFLTGIITNGASHVSELLAAAYDFQNDLRDFVSDKLQTGTPPPTPIELIERLEKYINDMELTANTAVTLVEQKKARLQELANQLKQLCAEETARKKTEAAALRDTLQQKTTSVPAAASLPALQPQTPDDATPAEKNESIRVQAAIYFNSTLAPERNSIAVLKSNSFSTIDSTYQALLSYPYQGYDAFRYLPGTSDGFTRPYFEITDKVSTVTQWIATDVPNAITKMETSKNIIGGASAAVSESIDATMPGIMSLHAQSLWLEGYASLLGYSPTARLNFADLRNFDGAIAIAATPDKTADEVVKEIEAQQAVAESIKTNLDAGVSKREEWMNSEWDRYDSLKFNFDNSLSYVIAAIRQLDSLHSGPYFKRASYPYTRISGIDLYMYSVNIDAINAGIAGQPDKASRETARAAAVQELIQMKAEEETLLERLEIAQNSHLVDVQELDNFYAAAYARTTGLWSIADLIAEFTSVTGKPMKDIYTLWNDLVPDITYYFLGSNSDNWNWIRNRSTLATNLAQAMQLVSGKTTEYYQLLDLYNAMEVNKNYYLGLSLTDFNAFMTDTTLKIGSYPEGSYIIAFKMNNVWGVDYPSWQLVMKTNYRSEELNSAYRNYGALDPVAWAVIGSVKTQQGAPVPGVTVLLNGYLTASATTGSDGGYAFDFIGNGSFTVTVSGKGYQFDAAVKTITVNKTDTRADFIATPTAQSGYSIAGRITGDTGPSSAGIPVVASSSTGAELTSFTGADGSFFFSGVTGGTYGLRPVSATLEFTPANRTVVLPASAGGQDFIAAAAGSGDFPLKGDIDNDGSVTLRDAILVLQILSGVTPDISLIKWGDVNGDGKISLAEVIYILQNVAGMRQI